MSSEFCFACTVLGAPLTARLQPLDGGMRAEIYGGTRPHIGAVSIAGPDGKVSTTQFPAHRDGVVLATVYNNLNSLCQQGKIRKISVEGCPDRYDRNTRHDHLVCRRCGSLADIHLEDITAQLEQQTGFAIDGYDLKIQYLCPRCRAAQDSGQDRAESVQKSSDL
ncbi:transcriptional repressor [Faecalibacterium sp. An122]|uniref:Fur family transcriptional regulator n=1 Tax=Faecalibacterium sp. An122 TaxID=1965551 RepID=UPI001FA8747C|nr:transcriptional repressor [Faecalibacterium sp. An122]